MCGVSEREQSARPLGPVTAHDVCAVCAHAQILTDLVPHLHTSREGGGGGGGAGARAVLEPVQQALRSPDPAVRFAAVQACGALYRRLGRGVVEHMLGRAEVPDALRRVLELSFSEADSEQLGRR
jgi:hypothetical protein